MKIKLVSNRKKKSETLTIKTTKGEKLEYAQAELLFQGGLKPLLPFTYESKKEDTLFSYDVTDKVKIPTYLGAKLSLDQFRSLLENTIEAVEVCGKRGLPYTNMLFDAEYVYLDTESASLAFAYLPASGLSDERATIIDFLYTLAKNTTFICEEDTVYAHDLMDFLQRQTVFSLIDFKGFIGHKTLQKREDDKSGPLEHATRTSTEKTYDFLKTQIGSLSAQETHQNRSFVDQISYGIADKPASGSLDTQTTTSPTNDLPADFSQPLEALKETFQQEESVSSPLGQPSAPVSFAQEEPSTSSAQEADPLLPQQEIHPETPALFEVLHLSTSQKTTLPAEGDATIGRSSRCALPIKGNTNISREHALLQVKKDSCCITDLGSTNKTFVDGEEIPPHIPVEIKRNSRFSLADEEFVLQ